MKTHVVSRTNGMGSFQEMLCGRRGSHFEQPRRYKPPTCAVCLRIQAKAAARRAAFHRARALLERALVRIPAARRAAGVLWDDRVCRVVWRAVKWLESGETPERVEAKLVGWLHLGVVERREARIAKLARQLEARAPDEVDILFPSTR